jgi:3-deoxy-7-phosphoheptulonate synthase
VLPKVLGLRFRSETIYRTTLQPSKNLGIQSSGYVIPCMESTFHFQILLCPLAYDHLSPKSTLTSGTGLKTRNFGTIISELTSCLEIHAACDSRLGGVSLEFTGELNEEGFSVTECLGGSMELSEEQLGLRYQVGGLTSRGHMSPDRRLQSFCDPRLNFEQSLGMTFKCFSSHCFSNSHSADVAFLISNHFKKQRRGHTGADVLYSELGGVGR